MAFEWPQAIAIIVPVLGLTGVIIAAIIKGALSRNNQHLNDRVVTLEARVKFHAETLERMDDIFKEINRKLDEINKNLPRK